jgi:hypothetical protein
MAKTTHKIINGDSRQMNLVPDNSVHLVNSPHSAWSTKNQSPLVFSATIPNLAPVIFCKSVKDQKPVLKTGQIHPQQIPVLPDCSEQNTAKAEMNYSIPVVGSDSGGKNIVEVWMTGNIVGKKNIQQGETGISDFFVLLS